MGEPKGPNQFPQKSKELLEEAQIKELIEKLSVQYKVDQSELSVLNYVDLPRLIEIFGSLDNLKGKRILDLGCGSINSPDREDNYESRSFEPWFCRALLELGADPVGVDINPDIEKEKFKNHRLNLLDLGALNIFPDNSFDGINLTGLFDSPILNRVSVLDEDREAMKREVAIQIKRLLKHDGKIVSIKNYFDEGALKAELGL